MRDQIRRFLSKWPWPLTRAQKLIRNTLCIFVLLAACYRLLGCPPLTAEHAFRQAEHQNLVGPAEILAKGSLQELPVQETEYEISTFEKDWETLGFFAVGEQSGSLSCVWQRDGRLYFTETERTGDVVFVPLWQCFGRYAAQGGLLLVKTDLEGAATVRVHLWAYNEYRYSNYGETYRNLCNLEGTGAVLGNGVFMVPVVASAMTLSSAADEERPPELAQITIYDRDGAVIYDKMWLEDEGGTYYESGQEPVIG